MPRKEKINLAEVLASLNTVLLEVRLLDLAGQDPAR
jgi:hypothetical protein